MTPRDVVNATLVPGTKSVLVLGFFEKRVTVYSQQIRAINLVDAIMAEGLVRENGKVAIVGGGIAGMTAAVALARAAPNLKQLDLFEKRPDVLELQHGSHRHLHPHFYDWPAPGSSDPDAGLPIMNWRAGPAGVVAETLRAEFDATVKSKRLQPFLGHEVLALNPNRLSQVRVVTADRQLLHRLYDAVILAIGFGLERSISETTKTYWAPSELAARVLPQAPGSIIFVSGNGDGGLVDFLMAAFNGLDHGRICELLANLDLGDARAEIEAIENEAWEVGADIDLLEAYQTRVLHLVPPAAWADIKDALRPDMNICLHTKEKRLLRRTTALHNRLATFLVIEADKDMGRNAISVRVGKEFAGSPPLTGQVELSGESPFVPALRCLRLGADGESNFAPFQKLLEEYRTAAASSIGVGRPASPRLTDSARQRFERLRVPSPVPGPGVQAVVAARPMQRIHLRINSLGQMAWAGDVAPAAAEQHWADGAVTHFYCDASAADAAGLVSAVARIGAHAHDFTLYARDFAGWQAALSALCSVDNLPAADLGIRCTVTSWSEPPELPLLQEGSIAEVSSTVHMQLDATLLRLLHDATYKTLGPAAEPSGWPIDPALRGTLWETWVQWKSALDADASTRRRFLRLLANLDDQANAADGTLVRLGPKVLRPHLTKPTVFGLAFSACSGSPMRPAARHPGNMALEQVSGHACGSGLIGSTELRGRSAARHTWTTNVVLLSHLQEAVQLLEGSDLRLDQSASDVTRVGLATLNEKPIVIGADADFLAALEGGSQAVELFFKSIIDRRSRAQDQSIERA